jgi:hypothetical protein
MRGRVTPAVCNERGLPLRSVRGVARIRCIVKNHIFEFEKKAGMDRVVCTMEENAASIALFATVLGNSIA